MSGASFLGFGLGLNQLVYGWAKRVGVLFFWGATGARGGQRYIGSCARIVGLRMRALAESFRNSRRTSGFFVNASFLKFTLL